MAEVSREYGTAFFMLACEKNAKHAYEKALDLFQKSFREQPDYLTFLASPGIPVGERLAAIYDAFAAHVPEDALSFLQLLCEKGRILCFFDSVLEFKKLLAASEHIIKACVKSAVPLTEEEKKQLQYKLKAMHSCAVETTYAVDESLLGGVIVEIDGRVLDGSVRSHLRNVKEVMSQ